MLGLSLAFSAFSVIRVMSAPMADPPAQISVPYRVGFEGYLINGTTPVTGTHTLDFNIYYGSQSDPNCANGSSQWHEQQTSVIVNNGTYAVQSGSVNTTLDPSYFTHNWTCIGVTLDGGNEMTPRTQIASVPFALNAANANTVNNLSVKDTGGLDQHVVASDISGTVTLSGGLNVGPIATPAAAGEIRASGNIYSNGRLVSGLTSSYEQNLYLIPLAPNGFPNSSRV